ncbi:efflux RND transporter periplasmic adaptor subunit [Bradyrhizobium yuanmingense]|uniref:efflux RND transporter periplasmic adaptor subunit n=1 Tax=Bradyrhizobium yuanmingense TaxID=108015 RepID=UPI0012FC6BBD|nr:efflux RND transporter periplasmic adaptor subunit [Bradyrhizobium yuanmingense]MVT52081.1 efflux RND transporter periplasmic adaptor subunit [Bradyrhizobium yuanmingense]
MNFNRPIEPERLAEPGQNQDVTPRGQTRRGGRLAGFSLILISGALLAAGAWRQYAEHRQVLATAEQQRDFVPQVRVAAVEPADQVEVVELPATTSAFASANIFARASGYIAIRAVDIGDHVKAGQLLAEINAPELDHQIAQAEATLAQLNWSYQQAQANRELAKVTWDRDRPLVDKGWVTAQQGTIDEQTLKAQEAAVSVAQANITAEQAQLQVLRQQKLYQRVVAPFDGVITQRNVDVGSLVQADATSGTFMFTLQQGSVIRTQVFVPQDAAFNLRPGIAAIVHVPEIPDRTFPGTVTRIADALQPGSRTLLTEVDIPNPDAALTSGIYCTVELRIPRRTPSFQISADAVIFNAKGMQVAVVANGIVHFRTIHVLRDLGRQLEVDSGVERGDQIILNPSVDLADGAKVQIRTTSAAS